jgi:hypothetical protein
VVAFGIGTWALRAIPGAGPAAERLLGRLHIHAISITRIGKETNLLEQQEEGVLIADPQAVYRGEGEWGKGPAVP